MEETTYEAQESADDIFERNNLEEVVISAENNQLPREYAFPSYDKK